MQKGVRETEMNQWKWHDDKRVFCKAFNKMELLVEKPSLDVYWVPTLPCQTSMFELLICNNIRRYMK